MRSQFVTITVPVELITQVLQELLAMASDPNMVDVTDGDNGRIILAHPDLAEAWYQQVLAKENGTAPKEVEKVAESIEKVADPTEEITEPVEKVAESTKVVAGTKTFEPSPVPIKRGPGRPPKSSYTSASNGEEP